MWRPGVERPGLVLAFEAFGLKSQVLIVVVLSLYSQLRLKFE
jgi:hypothetical protein